MTETPQQDRVDTDHLRDYSRLRRSLTDRKLAGVAGGLGRHLNIDPTILRVAFVVLAFFGGAGLLLYVALWLVVPEEGKEHAPIATSPDTRNTILVIVAAIAALLLIGDTWGDVGFPWPIAVGALVVGLILLNRDKPVSTTTPPPPGTPTPPPGTPSAPAAWDAGATPASPTYDDTEPTAPLPPGPPSYALQQPPPAPAPQPYRGPLLFGLTLALIGIALGSLGLYDVAQGGVPDAAYPALALTVVGVMLVVGAWFGRPGGLILLGVVASIGLLATSVADPRAIGDQSIVEAPTRAVQVEDLYAFTAGATHLDLSNIRDVARLDGRTVEIEGNAGQIIVTLPDNLDVDVTATVAMAGEVQVLDERHGGTGVSMTRTVDGGDGAAQLDLDLHLLVGDIEVRQ